MLATSRIFLFTSLALVVSAVNVRGGPKIKDRGLSEGLLRKADDGKHKLRICNAYPHMASLAVFRSNSSSAESLTSNEPIEYRSCRDFKTELKNRDTLDFRHDQTDVGSFSVLESPEDSAVLLLVIHSRDQSSTAAAFLSHVFADRAGTQLAIIDAYVGPAKASAHIRDTRQVQVKFGTDRDEELPFNTVVAINPGAYGLVFKGEDNETKVRGDLIAIHGETYVVLRIGAGSAHPEEMVVYPTSDPMAMFGGARASSSQFCLMLSFATFLLAQVSPQKL